MQSKQLGRKTRFLIDDPLQNDGYHIDDCVR